MGIRTEFPYAIREIENTWIPLQDGGRLAARIWLPVDAERRPVPAILEYIPYRKDDATAHRDSGRHPYFAGFGYASIRVDMRGSGDSDGILYDEYLLQEQDDALEVIAWIARQPWCTGKVGMIGKSWGGFNGLQVAARRPPALAAVITLCSTDDRYNNDCHYMGGCLLGSDMLSWASYMLAYNARPPDPRFVGDAWRRMWLERLEQTPPFIEAWLSHPRQDEFWKHGSVGMDYSAIRCPIFAVGGWADPYVNAIPQLLAGLSVPRKGLIGPWSHNYPELGSPGPAIGFLKECLRWWDYWLKGIETGVMQEPMLRAWIQESAEPQGFYPERPGRWVAEQGWPTSNVRDARLFLNSHALGPKPEPETRLEIRGEQRAGMEAGVWCPYGGEAELPGDQRTVDGQSLTFTSQPLSTPVDILGYPRVELEVAADRPLALVAVRLCDVAPDGSSSLVSWGLLNLTHRDSHERPVRLDPGRRYRVQVRLNAVGHRILAGHCWRVGVSPTYWPHAWPSPEPVTLSLFTGATSCLVLPVRASRPEDTALPPFGEAEWSALVPVETVRAPSRARFTQHDLLSGLSELVYRLDSGRERFVGNGLEHEESHTDRHTIVRGDPLSATVECEWDIRIGRGDWQTRIAASSKLTADQDRFLVTCALEAYEGEVRVYATTRAFAVPRDHL
jgi:putative CocE/NonD family hydrolase